MINRIIQHFRLDVLSISEVEDSYSSTVYICNLQNGENVYVKIPYSKLKYHRELEAYNLLKGNVSIPEMLDYWSGDEECCGAFLLAALKGRPLTTAASHSVAFQVGEVHATMHTIKANSGEKLNTIQNAFPNWSVFIEDQFYSFAEDVKDILPTTLYKQALEKFAEMKLQLPTPDGPSFIHMDFRPANILVDDDKVSGVIDFESVRFGSTEIDFTKLYRDFLSIDSALYKAYREGYESIRPLIDLDSVLPFYQFTDAFNSIGWCKRRGVEENAVFMEENLGRLQAFLR